MRNETSLEYLGNQKIAKKEKNLRAVVSIEQLTVLSNIESLSSKLITKEMEKSHRFLVLKEVALNQLKSIQNIDKKICCNSKS